MRQRRKRYRCGATGTIIDARGQRPPFEDNGSWAWVSAQDRCSHCGHEAVVVRPVEVTLVECGECGKFYGVKRERVLKRVK